MKLTITLPLPHRCLSPNYTVGSRGQRMGKAAKTKRYRCDSCIAACIAVKPEGPPNWKAATCRATFYHKDKRRRDSDNLLASLKSAFDGLKDASIIEDDSGLTHLPVVKMTDKAQPRVVIEIWQTEPTP